MEEKQALEVLRKEVLKKDVKEYIKRKLRTDDLWAKKALKLILSNQTEEERKCKSTIERNSIGFTGVESGIMTSLGRHLEEKGFLSDKQMEILKERIEKYWKQVLKASDELKLLKLVKEEKKKIKVIMCYESILI
jgi:hypothetical protein